MRPAITFLNIQLSNSRLFIVIVYHTIAEYVQVFESDTKWKKKQKKMHRRIRYDKIREEESDDVIDTEKR